LLRFIEALYSLTNDRILQDSQRVVCHHFTIALFSVLFIGNTDFYSNVSNITYYVMTKHVHDETVI